MAVLDAFNLKAGSSISVLGHCGGELIDGQAFAFSTGVFAGAATFFRTLVRYPARFSKRNHVFHNCIIAQWPKGDA